MEKLIILILLCLFSFNGFSEINLLQLKESKVEVGEEILFKVSSEEEFVLKHKKELININILSYIYSKEIYTENNILFLKGIVTNNKKNFIPALINNEPILFNIKNENLNLTQIKLPNEYNFNLKDYYEFRFINWIRENKIFSSSVVGFFIFILIFLRFLFKKMKKKRNFKKEQNILEFAFRNAIQKSDFGEVYKLRKKLSPFFDYSEDEFQKIIEIIDANQYQKEWSHEDLEIIQKLLLKFKLRKKAFKNGG